jgi:hypothetical protein
MANPSLSEPQFHVDENWVLLLQASSFHCIDFFWVAQVLFVSTQLLWTVMDYSTQAQELVPKVQHVCILLDKEDCRRSLQIAYNIK